MIDILQMILSVAFSSSSLHFVSDFTAISDTDLTPNYLNQCWHSWLGHICVSVGLNKLNGNSHHEEAARTPQSPWQWGTDRLQFFPPSSRCICTWSQKHDDVIKWKHFPLYWPFVRDIHRSPVTFPSQRPVTRSFDVSLIYTWTNGRINSRDAGDLRRYRAYNDVTVMKTTDVEVGCNSTILFRQFRCLRNRVWPVVPWHTFCKSYVSKIHHDGVLQVQPVHSAGAFWAIIRGCTPLGKSSRTLFCTSQIFKLIF